MRNLFTKNAVKLAVTFAIGYYLGKSDIEFHASIKKAGEPVLPEVNING